MESHVIARHIAPLVNNRVMPPQRYVALHPEVKLNAVEIDQLARRRAKNGEVSQERQRSNSLSESLQLFEPVFKMATFLTHSLDADGSGRDCSLKRFPVRGVDRKNTFRQRSLGVVIDVLRSRKLVANSTEAIRQAGLPERPRESLRITEQQPFIFVQREIWDQANNGVQIGTSPADILLDGALNVFNLLNLIETRRSIRIARPKP